MGNCEGRDLVPSQAAQVNMGSTQNVQIHDFREKDPELDAGMSKTTKVRGSADKGSAIIEEMNVRKSMDEKSLVATSRAPETDREGSQFRLEQNHTIKNRINRLEKRPNEDSMEFEEERVNEGKADVKEKMIKFGSISKTLQGKNTLSSDRYTKENYYFHEETPYKFNGEYYTFECKGYFPASSS